MVKPATAHPILLRYLDKGNAGLQRNSPGMVRGKPSTASETERPVSSLGTILKPKRTRGKWRNQSELAKGERRADLGEQWKCSIIPVL